MTERVKQIIDRWKRLGDNRGLWLTHWEDVVRVSLPRRLGFVTALNEGDRRSEDLYDSTAIHAARSLANTMGGLLRPEGQPWFFLTTVEDSDSQTDEAGDWLADSEQRMRDAFDNPRSRFRQATGEIDLDLVTLGTALGFIGENISKSHLMFQSVHLKDGIPVYGEDGNLEGMFRERKMPLRLIKDKPGWTFSEATQKKIQDNQDRDLDDKIHLLFATLPRDEGRAAARLARNLPVADIVIEVDAMHEVFQSGFHEMPYIAPRWDTSSGEDYGRSPGMTALPDANTSNAIGETMLVAGQRAADPPLLAPSDSFIDAPNTFPGGWASYESDAVENLGSNPIRFLESGNRLPFAQNIQQDMREQIRIAFLRDRFNLPVPGDATMTATEVIARQEEFIREMGPVFGRIESDYTAPMVERAFNIMLRAGAFLPIPPALQGRSVRFEYESPVKRIRERSEAVAAEQWALQLTTLEQFVPGVVDNIDADELAVFAAGALSIPHRIVRGREKVAAIREQRNAELQAAQQAAEIHGAIETADVAASAAQKAGLTQQQGQANG